MGEAANGHNLRQQTKIIINCPAFLLREQRRPTQASSSKHVDEINSSSGHGHHRLLLWKGRGLCFVRRAVETRRDKQDSWCAIPGDGGSGGGKSRLHRLVIREGDVQDLTVL